jgi:carboxylesterase type B
MLLTLVFISCLLLHVSSVDYGDEYDDLNLDNLDLDLELFSRTVEADGYCDASCSEPPANKSQSYKRQPDQGIVYIEGGRIKGEETELGFSYRGIPYAEPPVGDLRFANPKKYSQKWSNVRDYSKFRSRCAQYDHNGYKFEGSEDCLTLNVFVPRTVLAGSVLAPVIFFIGGSGFMFGGAEDYGADNFMTDQRMILVTMNYRLGILGFLSTGDSAIPGNLGLKDQVEALRWVQRNIAAFNGDPKSVTLSGFSAGAASVHLHYLSPLTKGLFAKGISHSGTAIDPWVMQEEAAQKSSEVAFRFGCHKTEKPDWLLTCLRGVPVHELVMFATHFQRFLYNPFSPFGVVVEPRGNTAYITDNPITLMDRGLFKMLPWVLFQTVDDGLFTAAEFVDKKTMQTVDVEWISIAPYLLNYVSKSPFFKEELAWSEKIKQEYFKNESISLRTFHKFSQVENRSTSGTQLTVQFFR